MDTLSKEHKNLIEQTTRNAFIFGLGLIKSCREAFHEEGWTWTEEHERYLFDYLRRWTREI
jgi:hypothetical protein